jgi:hypothetical protein
LSLAPGAKNAAEPIIFERTLPRIVFLKRVIGMINRMVWAAVVLASLAVAGSAVADETGLVGGAIAGGVVGGPVGAVAGGVIGNAITNHHRYHHYAHNYYYRHRAY